MKFPSLILFFVFFCLLKSQTTNQNWNNTFDIRLSALEEVRVKSNTSDSLFLSRLRLKNNELECTSITTSWVNGPHLT